MVASLERLAPTPLAPDVERAPKPLAATAHGRLGALDGLRAIAVIAVVVYHFWPRALPSGFLGVDVFMVVSGFIVTRLLVDERQRTGRVRLGGFLGRRFRRLVPALALLLACVAIWTKLVETPAIAASVREQGIAALAYVTNWHLIAAGVSYGGVVGSQSPLVHLWSLAVEEQFYLVWAVVLAAVFAVGRGRRGPLIAVAAGGALVSAVLMAAWYQPGSDPIRLYYGTDTRAQAFLMGVVAALFLAHGPTPSARTHRVMGWVGVFALTAVLAVMFTDSPGVLYRGGFALVAIGAAFAAVATTHPGPITKLLDRGPARSLGRVSYGVYLWHWPAVVFVTPARLGVGGLGLALARVGVTAAGTAASWFLLERPLGRARPGRVAIVGVAVIAVAAVTLSALPSRSLLAYSNYRVDRIPAPKVVSPNSSAPKTAPVPSAPPNVSPPSTSAPTASSSPPPFALPPTGTAMIVGDSGMFTAMPALTSALQTAGWEVVQTAYPGVGLTQPDGVRDRWRDNAQRYGVGLTIAMIGGWDAAWIRQRGAAAYRSVIDDSVGAFTSAGGKVLWLSILPGHNGDDRTIEQFFAALPAKYPGRVAYLDIQASLRAPDGSFPQFVDGRRLRGPDGWHLCPDGAAAVTHFTLRALGLDRPGWDGGSWRADPRYAEGHCNR